MKITGFIALLILISQSILAQEADTLEPVHEEAPAVILEDTEDEVSVGMNEIIKFDEKGDTTRIKIRDKEFSVIEGDTTKLKDIIAKKEVIIKNEISDAIDHGKKVAKKEDLICITGSLFTVGEAKDHLQKC